MIRPQVRLIAGLNIGQVRKTPDNEKLLRSGVRVGGRVPAAGHGAACELIHNHNLATLDDVVNLPLEELFRLDGVQQE